MPSVAIQASKRPSTRSGSMRETGIDLPELPFQASMAGQLSAFDLFDWLTGKRGNIVETYPATE
ncbi:hypothetical protein ASG87_09595 [Frateuria sp. Soil773]|nr:hypothetical protein ASG87_09595 [Frateuria sp. Soil773]